MRAELNWFWVWLILGWLMIVAIILLSLVSISTPALFSYQDKAFHVLAYFLLMGWFAQLYPRPRHLLWLILLVALGVGLEFVQGATRHRTFEYLDMAANSLGVAIAWLLAATPFARLLVWFERRVLRLQAGEFGATTDDPATPGGSETR